MDNYFENINAIALFCDKKNIPYTLHTLFDGLQIRFPWTAGDIACHSGTICPLTYVESFRFPWDGDDVTVHTSNEVCARLLAYWNEKQDC